MRMKNKGFTLVELLLAVAIFGAVASTLFLTFNTIISNVNPMTGAMDHYESGIRAMDRLKADLMALYLAQPPVYYPPGGDRPRDRFRFVLGERDIQGRSFSLLRFASFEHLGFYPEDTDALGILSYFVTPGKGGLVLRRWDRGLTYYREDGDPPLNIPVLCRGVQGFIIEAVDDQGEAQTHWHSDDPDHGYSTPISLRITLKIGDPQAPEVFASTLVLPSVRRKG